MIEVDVAVIGGGVVAAPSPASWPAISSPWPCWKRAEMSARVSPGRIFRIPWNLFTHVDPDAGDILIGPSDP